MADCAEDCGLTSIAIERIARRLRGADASRLAAFLRSRIDGGGDVGEIIEQLIRAIAEAERKGVTRYKLSQRTRIPQSTLARLVNRDRESLKVETVERLCHELGFTLEMRPARKRQRRR